MPHSPHPNIHEAHGFDKTRVCWVRGFHARMMPKAVAGHPHPICLRNRINPAIPKRAISAIPREKDHADGEMK
jgi:hypothetical protein